LLVEPSLTESPAPDPAPRRSIWSNPFLWAAVAGLILIPLMRPFLIFEPDPPPVLGQLPPYTLLDTAGEPFGSADLEGRVYVANFIFTRCTSICPLLTAAMGRLDRRYREERVEGVHLVSITVDPDYDTPERLREYAERHGADPSRWTFLTGPGDDVRDLVADGFKTAMGEPIGDGDNLIDIAHTGKFVLVDAEGGIRGYYDTDDLGLDEVFHRSRHLLRR
jgi:protein SCO1/2